MHKSAISKFLFFVDKFALIRFWFAFWFQMLEASLYVSQNLPEGGLWAVVHCATWVALGELEWIPFAVLRKSIDVNLLGKLLFWAELSSMQFRAFEKPFGF